jgi:hypothetical protein
MSEKLGQFFCGLKNHKDVFSGRIMVGNELSTEEGKTDFYFHQASVVYGQRIPNST